jgi:formate hydrogenlyase subunit 6/NADH:ubiquinone oxidoreductase subunit I
VQNLCVKCDACFNACPAKFRAVRKISPASAVPE